MAMKYKDGQYQHKCCLGQLSGKKTFFGLLLVSCAVVAYLLSMASDLISVIFVMTSIAACLYLATRLQPGDAMNTYQRVESNEVPSCILCNGIERIQTAIETTKEFVTANQSLKVCFQ